MIAGHLGMGLVVDGLLAVVILTYDFSMRGILDVGCVASDILLLLHGQFAKTFLEHTSDFDLDIVFR
jgi:hypothetical protein